MGKLHVMGWGQGTSRCHAVPPEIMNIGFQMTYRSISHPPRRLREMKISMSHRPCLDSSQVGPKFSIHDFQKELKVCSNIVPYMKVKVEVPNVLEPFLNVRPEISYDLVH